MTSTPERSSAEQSSANQSSAEQSSDSRSVDLAYRSIREQILSGEQQGGEWLRESDLATSIGVSRTPVREALRRLAAEGLVRHERNRGVQVQSWTLKDLADVYAIRSLLEPWACGMAAAGGMADIDLLQQLADDMSATAGRPHADLDALTELNSRFHTAILEASGNDRIRGLLASLVQLPLVWRTFSHYTPEELRRSLTHHHELVDAIRARNATWAESVMRAHIQSAWTSVRREAGGEEYP
ncbi:GntR family transcriptional regulator [Rathayibacter soli]|uniref:GntR family transcriptional regulator n=1 Tax=Rathayibacter soli TaxID=3144168 RepID=UPI0027E40F9D|nr:GntR family transcriptional regulator [Glaciibacter superstes]